MTQRGRRGPAAAPRRHGRRAWLATFGLLAALALPAPAPATAQSATEPVSDLQVTVSELTGVLGPGTAVVDTSRLDPRTHAPGTEDELLLRVLVENTGDQPLDQLRLIVELHAPVRSRGQLHDALGDGPDTEPQQVLHDEPIRSGDAIAPDAIAGVQVAVEVDDVDWDGGGVYPLGIAVARGTDVLAEVHTAVVWLPQPVTDPLLTSLVWPVGDRPWQGANGTYEEGVDRAIEPGERLDVLLATLERRTDPPVVLAPSVALAEDLRDRADGFTAVTRRPDGSSETRLVDPEDPPAQLARETLHRLRDVSRGLPFAPVAGAYADADVTALSRHGTELTALGAEAAVEGRRRLALQLDRASDAATYLADERLTPEVLDLVPGDQVLVPTSAVADRTGEEVTALAPLRSNSGRLFTAIVADRQIGAWLASPPSGAGPVVDAQRILAETAQAWFQAPGATGRSLLLLPPDDWAPSAETAERLLDALETAPWAQLTSPGHQAALGRQAATPVRLHGTTAVSLDPALAASLSETVAELSALETALPDDADTADGRTPSELHDVLLRSTSATNLDNGGTAGEALVRDVRRTIEETFGDVVVASGSRVTLTSDTGQIPVTLQRTRGGPIAVRVEVASQGRLVWPDGQRSEVIELTEGAAQTVSFATRALSTGTFSVAVRVTDPTGTHTLERTTLSVRSAAISGPALAATGGAVLLLLLAGALRRRRPRPPRLAVVEPPPDPVKHGERT
ncbi:DUF6049 family protein [Egicoccus halophilus]|uniref:Glycoprotein n=1 Tax=Egicoccus halophilus TaxID=1670830 RepID=A0A8J3ESF9_9ACTN|nr:DUF6049 family protein [Egicoccus halophilus]GGI03177.1 hypothetical protein GCM10011354_02880 [Egicoccus halophilus]